MFDIGKSEEIYYASRMNIYPVNIERTDLNKDKTGVFSGAYAINPITNQKVPIWVADYVLSGYGTGAVMAVPGHDLRDHEFASKYDLEVAKVIDCDDSDIPYTGDGELINSELLNGLSVQEAKSKIISYIDKEQLGSKHTTVSYTHLTLPTNREV